MKKYIYKLFKKFLNIFLFIFSKEFNTVYFGSNYGGWHFVTPSNNKKLIVVSAGVGEDISFDIKFLNNFDSEIYFVDPTPRALIHLQNVINNLGTKSTTPLLRNSGKQNINSYDLEKIERDKIHIIKKALYSSIAKDIKFYPPKNEEHVSYSISNFQENYAHSNNYIQVESTTVEDILQNNGIDHIDIIKLDIEGAETRVIPDMMKKNIYPDQILVEFDELNIESIKALIKIFFVILQLITKGYKSIEINNFPNFLFVKGSYLRILKEL